MFATDESTPQSTDSAAAIPMSFSSLKETMAAGGEHLGDVTYWTLANADVPRPILEAKWAMAGLNKDLLPEEQTPEKALRLAVKAASLGMKGRMIKNTMENKTMLVFAVVKDIVDEKGNYDSSQETLIVLDKAATPPTVTAGDPTNTTAMAVLAEYSKFINAHTSRDIAATIVKTLKSFKAITLRDTGGIYWVPRTQAENLRRLQGAVEGLGGSRVYLLPVHETAEASSALGAAASGSIEVELASLREEIEGFMADPEGGPRADTLERRLQAFEELRGRASLYQSILHVTVSDLDGQLDAMATSVKKMLDLKDVPKV